VIFNPTTLRRRNEVGEKYLIEMLSSYLTRYFLRKTPQAL